MNTYQRSVQSEKPWSLSKKIGAGLTVTLAILIIVVCLIEFLDFIEEANSTEYNKHNRPAFMNTKEWYRLLLFVELCLLTFVCASMGYMIFKDGWSALKKPLHIVLILFTLYVLSFSIIVISDSLYKSYEKLDPSYKRPGWANTTAFYNSAKVGKITLIILGVLLIIGMCSKNPLICFFMFNSR